MRWNQRNNYVLGFRTDLIRKSSAVGQLPQEEYRLSATSDHYHGQGGLDDPVNSLTSLHGFRLQFRNSIHYNNTKL